MPVRVGPLPLPTVVLSRDIGPNAAREAQASGLVRVCHGAFAEPLADAGSWETAKHLARARVNAMSHRLTNGAVFSDESAALIHGLWLLRTPSTVHVTQRTKPRQQTSLLRRHSGELPPEDVVEVNGIRVTSLERTVADCAKSMHPRDALVVVDSAMRLVIQPRRDQRQTVTEQAEVLRGRLLAAVDGGGARRGRRQARAVIAHADPYSESPYETVVRWIAVSHGLPRPLLQVRFDVRGSTYYTDMCWVFERTVGGERFRLRIIGEYDGEFKYLGTADVPPVGDAAPNALIAEKRREDDLRSLPGTAVLRFDRRDANNPEATFHRLCALLPASYVATLRPVPTLAGLAAPRRRTA